MFFLRLRKLRNQLFGEDNHQWSELDTGTKKSCVLEDDSNLQSVFYFHFHMWLSELSLPVFTNLYSSQMVKVASLQLLKIRQLKTPLSLQRFLLHFGKKTSHTHGCLAAGLLKATSLQHRPSTSLLQVLSGVWTPALQPPTAQQSWK